jgi:hypothetical protein
LIGLRELHWLTIRDVEQKSQDSGARAFCVQREIGCQLTLHSRIVSLDFFSEDSDWLACRKSELTATSQSP